MSAESDTSVTAGELLRSVALIRSDIKDVKQDVSNLPTIRDIGYLEARIIELEEWQKWAMRVGVPSVIAVIVNLFDTVGKVLK